VDEGLVRRHAEAHGRAVANGDLAVAGSDLDGAARSQAAAVMKSVPGTIEGAEVQSVEAAGDGFVVRTRYWGGGSEATVEARWEDRGGRPMIVGLRLR
jgi:hypothetical protein